MPPRFQEEAVQSIDRIITDSLSDVAEAAADAGAAAGMMYDSTNERARLFVALSAALFLFNRVVVFVTQSLLFRRYRVRRVCADADRASHSKNGAAHAHEE